MKQFGYLEQGTNDSDALYSEEAVVDAIKTVQRFGAIPETGFIDNATLQVSFFLFCFFFTHFFVIFFIDILLINFRIKLLFKYIH